MTGMPIVARILIRKDKIAGLFIPMGNSILAMHPGIWQVHEVLGEYQLKFIGKPAMPEGRLNGVTLDTLVGETALAMMTEEELAKVTS